MVLVVQKGVQWRITDFTYYADGQAIRRALSSPSHV
jgi:hypothetical protein